MVRKGKIASLRRLLYCLDWESCAIFKIFCTYAIVSFGEMAWVIEIGEESIESIKSVRMCGFY